MKREKILDRPIRLGVIGCGNVLGAYQEAIARLRERGLVEVSMACGRSSQREAACRELRPKHFTLEAGRVLESPVVDLVLVLTSMNQHGPLVSAALAAGKHVLVEKPLSTNLLEAKKILCQPRKTHLVCAPFTTLSPTFRTLAELVRRGQIGRVCNARARYGWAGPEWSEWFFRKGGGALFDLGVYDLTTLTGLLGPARRVTALAGVSRRERTIRGKKVRVMAEDNAQVLLDFGGDCFASVMTGFTLQQYRSPAVEIYGTTGTVQMMGDDWAPDGYELWRNEIGAWQVFKETAPRWSWTSGLDHLVDCLRAGTEPMITPEHAYHVLEIMTQAQASAKEGRVKEIKSIFPPPVFPPLHRLAGEAHLIHDRWRASEAP